MAHKQLSYFQQIQHFCHVTQQHHPHFAHGIILVALLILCVAVIYVFRMEPLGKKEKVPVKEDPRAAAPVVVELRAHVVPRPLSPLFVPVLQELDNPYTHREGRP